MATETHILHLLPSLCDWPPRLAALGLGSMQAPTKKTRPAHRQRIRRVVSGALCTAQAGEGARHGVFELSAPIVANLCWGWQSAGLAYSTIA